MKNIETGVKIERECTKFLHELLDEKDKTVHVNIDDIANVKPDEPQFIRSDESMKSIEKENTSLSYLACPT